MILTMLSPLRSLTTRLMLVTTVIVVLSSASLSLVFIHQEIDHTHHALQENGALIAQRLAESSRYSVLANDGEQIQRLAQAELSAETVMYVVVVGQDGHALATAHKPLAARWFKERPAHDLLSIHTPDSKPLSSRFVGSEPVVSLLRQNSSTLEPISRSVDSWSSIWSLLSSQTDLPLYDTMVPIRPSQRFETGNGTLGAAFSVPAGTPALPLYGAVAVGLSGAPSHRALRDLIERMLLTTMLVIAIAVGLTAFTARRITAPVVRLRNAAMEIASGAWDAAIPTQGRDEVGDLGHALEEMTATLRTRDLALRTFTHQLEDKVRARTHDLEVANVQLLNLDRLRTELVSCASHELRTPLTSIKVHVENLCDGSVGSLSTDQMKTLQRIRANIDRLRTLLEDLLDLSRLQSGKGGQRMQRKPVKLHDVMHEVITHCDPLATKKHLVISNHLPLETLLIEGDQPALVRVFMNLVENAIKFSSVWGTIRIEAKRPAPDLVTVSIIDQGCGIPPEDLANVFLPFFRSPALGVESKGTGLGLAIAKQLVEAHQGTIDARSTLGCGSEFRVTLPANPE